jgi:tetratricopeptide (TPR) repeat protein
LFGTVATGSLEEAQVLLKSKRYTQATMLYRKLLQEKEQTTRRAAYEGLIEIYLIRQQVDELFALVEMGLKEYPDDPNGLAAMAAAWGLKAKRSTSFSYKMHQAGQALEFADKALTRDPNNDLALYVKSLINFHMPKFFGRMPSVIDDLKKILQSKGEHKDHFIMDAYWFLAKAHREMRHNDDALAVLNQALKLWPNHPSFLKLYQTYMK